MMRFRIAPALGCVLLLAVAAGARTVEVSSVEELNDAISAAEPGDRIIVANGEYTTDDPLTITHQGIAEQPISIEAETIGGVTIRGAGGFRIEEPAAHIVIQGFRFRHSGPVVVTRGTQHIRITRNDFERPAGESGHYLEVEGADHEIDHNLFQNKTSNGMFIRIDRPRQSNRDSHRTHIHHNHFRNHNGSGEAVTTWGPHSIFENNLFEECNGDPEIISVKASDGAYRGNTFINSAGGLVLRFARRCTIEGNFFINCRPGMRIYGNDHRIFNNYFENNSDAIMVGDGRTFEDGRWNYIRCENIEIVFNTLVDQRGDAMRPHGNAPEHAPLNMAVANNIIVQHGGTFIRKGSPWENPTIVGNIVWGNAERGIVPEEGNDMIDPRLVRDEQSGVYRLSPESPGVGEAMGSWDFVTHDMDGQRRSQAKDIGADQYSTEPILRRRLTSDDVGPTANLDAHP